MKTLLTILTTIAISGVAQASDDTHWMKIKATNKFQRSKIANTGAVIENIGSDYVIAFGTDAELKAVKKTGLLLQNFVYDFHTMDFPGRDANFHNYAELLKDMQDLALSSPELVAYEVIGKSLEGRDLVNLRISTDLANSSKKPAVSFMGSHHAREHLSTEIPLLLAQYLVNEYKNKNPEVVKLLETREVNIIPLVNPDGSEYDISTGNYKAWRKNRHRNSDGTYGVDLNRNYGYQWGTGGSSNSGSSDVYMGAAPFSEPETQTIRNFIDGKPNVTTLLSFHTFSELVLYPWGHKYNAIETARDLKVFETMATTMAAWNGYTPQQASDLYIASGDTTDWAYGTHKIFAFTFELDPRNAFGVGGFYPGQAVIPVVFQKNLKPCLYLIEHADNPYRTIDGNAFGLQSNMLQ